MQESEIRDKVWTYLKESFLYMRPDLQVGADESLLRAGVIDSLGVMEVIGFVEELGGFQVAEEDVTEANFGTLNAITRYVLSKAA